MPESSFEIQIAKINRKYVTNMATITEEECKYFKEEGEAIKKRLRMIENPQPIEL